VPPLKRLSAGMAPPQGGRSTAVYLPPWIPHTVRLGFGPLRPPHTFHVRIHSIKKMGLNLNSVSKASSNPIILRLAGGYHWAGPMARPVIGPMAVPEIVTRRAS
jgi:hypothetical protein